MGILAACIKLIKLPHKPKEEIVGAFPIWMIKDNDKHVLAKYMMESMRMIQEEGLNEQQIKFKFLMIAQNCPLALALAIPTEQPIKLFMKPKMIYLTEKCNILEEFSIRSIVKWAIDKEKFIIDVKGKDGKGRKQAVFTHFSHICSGYLSLVTKMISAQYQAIAQKDNEVLKHV